MKKERKEFKPAEELKQKKDRVYRAFNQNQSIMPKSSFDYPWPEFKNDKERIKYYARLVKEGHSISKLMCGIEPREDWVEPELPITPVVGGFYKAVLSKQGNKLTIDGISAKEQIVVKNNFNRYQNMNVTNYPVDVKVVSIDKVHQTVYVDVLQAMFESWISSVIKDKSIQYHITNPQIVTVHNLKLANGGFIGKAEVPSISQLIGEPYYVDAFIPGSQIVLNIENDFEKWNGKSVDTFIAGYTTKPGSVNQMSLICSRKALLNFSGNLTKIELYKDYCDDGKKWETFTKSTFTGIVTGVINSSKKCGVFVELPMFNITGMVNLEPERLVDFKSGEQINVRITDFEKMLEYNPTTGAMEHLEPYRIENNCLKSCILKPVLELV